MPDPITIGDVAHWDANGLGDVRLVSGRKLGFLSCDRERQRWAIFPYAGYRHYRTMRSGSDLYRFTTVEAALQEMIDVTNAYDAHRLTTKAPRQWGQRRNGKRGGRRGKGYESEVA